MTVNIRETLATIAERSKQIDGADDDIGRAILTIENELARRLTVRIVAKIEDDPDFTAIGFGKQHGGAWRLFVVNASGIEIELAKTSRRLRSKAFLSGHVKRLIREAPERLAEQVREREATLAAVDDVLELLELQ